MDQSVKIPPLLSLDFAFPSFPPRRQGFYNMGRFARRPPPCMERSPYFEMDIEESSNLDDGVDRSPGLMNRRNYPSIDMASIVERPPWFGMNLPANNRGIMPNCGPPNNGIMPNCGLPNNGIMPNCGPAHNGGIMPNCGPPNNGIVPNCGMGNPQNCARPQATETPAMEMRSNYGGWRNMEMSTNFGWNMGTNHFNINEKPFVTEAPPNHQITPNMKMIENSLRSLGVERNGNCVGAQIENTTKNNKGINVESDANVENNNNNNIRGLSVGREINLERCTSMEGKGSLQTGTGSESTKVERRASISRGTSIESEIDFEKLTSIRRGASMDGFINTQREINFKSDKDIKSENTQEIDKCIEIDSSPDIDNYIPFITDSSTDSGSAHSGSVAQENAALKRKVNELQYYLQNYAEKIKIFKLKAQGYKTKCKEYKDAREKLILSGSPLVFGAGDQKKRQRDKMIIEKDCKIMDLKEELHSKDKKITELSNEISSKDLELISLKREKEELEEEKKCWEEKEDMGEHLKDQVAENNSLIDQIQDMAMRFEDILNEKNEEISNLQMISNEKDKNIEMDIDILNKKNSEIKKLTEKISSKDKEISKLRQFSEELQNKLKYQGRIEELIDDAESDTQHILCNEKNGAIITQSSMLNNEEEYLERNVKVEKQEHHELREAFNNNELTEAFENTDFRDSCSIGDNSAEDFPQNDLMETSETTDTKNHLKKSRLGNHSFEASCLGDDLKKRRVGNDSKGEALGNDLKESCFGNYSGESISSNDLRESIDSNWSDVNIKLEEIVESFYPELKDTLEFPISPSTSLTLSSSTDPILCSMSPLTISTMTSLITPVMTPATNSINMDKSIVDQTLITSTISQTVTSISAITTLTPFSNSPIMTPSLCSSMDTLFTFSSGSNTNCLVSYAVTTPPSSPNPALAEKDTSDKKPRYHSDDPEEKLVFSRRRSQSPETSSYFDEIKKKYYRQRQQQLREDIHQRIISIRHNRSSQQRKIRKFVTRKRSSSPEPRRKITHERRRSLDIETRDDHDDYFKVRNDNDYYNRITKDRKITIIDDPRDVDIRETVHSLKESKNRRTVTLVKQFNFTEKPPALFNKPGLPIRVEIDEKRMLGPNCNRCFQFHHETVCPHKTTSLKCRYPPCTNKVGHVTRTCHELMMRCRLPECNNQRGHRSDCHYNPQGVKPFGRGRLAAYRLRAVFLRYRHLLTSDEKRRICIYQETNNNSKLRVYQQTNNNQKVRIYQDSKVKFYPEPNNSKVKIYPEPNNSKVKIYSEPNNCEMRKVKRRRKSSGTTP